MHVEKVYGLFPGGDPRKFRPDVSECTPEEIARHKEACRAWDEGRGEDRNPSCATLGDGSAWTGTGFGIGVYEVEMPDSQEEMDAMIAADEAKGASDGE